MSDRFFSIRLTQDEFCLLIGVALIGDASDLALPIISNIKKQIEVQKND